MPPPKDPIKYLEYIRRQSESHKDKHPSEKTLLKMSQSKMGNTSGKGNKNIPKSEEHKKKIRDSNIGKYRSEETKQNMKKNRPDFSGEKNGMYDKKHKLESINKMSEAHWKGGKKLSNARHTAKRRQLGFIPLNHQEFYNWVGHHIDHDYIIYIPEELHKSVYHNREKNINMDLINDKVYDWFIGYYFWKE